MKFTKFTFELIENWHGQFVYKINGKNYFPCTNSYFSDVIFDDDSITIQAEPTGGDHNDFDSITITRTDVTFSAIYEIPDEIMNKDYGTGFIDQKDIYYDIVDWREKLFENNDPEFDDKDPDDPDVLTFDLFQDDLLHLIYYIFDRDLYHGTGNDTGPFQLCYSVYEKYQKKKRGSSDFEIPKDKENMLKGYDKELDKIINHGIYLEFCSDELIPHKITRWNCYHLYSTREKNKKYCYVNPWTDFKEKIPSKNFEHTKEIYDLLEFYCIDENGWKYLFFKDPIYLRFRTNCMMYYFANLYKSLLHTKTKVKKNKTDIKIVFN